MLVLTHIDRLPPISEWDPPYDLTDPTTPKAHSIRDAMEAAGADFGLDIEDIIAVSLVRDVAHVNVDVVWAKLIEVLPDAKRAQLLRCLSETRGGINWRRAFAQAVAGGRLVTRLFRRRQGGKGQGEESGSASSGDHSR